MNHFLRSGLLLIATFAVSQHQLRAQTVIYSTDFADAQGWTFSASNPPVEWAVDSTPGNVLSSLSWRSAPYSLNYNNGVNYYSGLSGNSGTATSPWIDLIAGSGTTTLRFWCNWNAECCLAPWDDRILSISDAQTQLYSKSYFNACGPAGNWHVHSVPLSPSWGAIQVHYLFSAADSIANQYEGWFIDDFEIVYECPTTTPYCTPKLNSLGCSPTIFTTGTPSLTGTGQAFRIWAGGVLNQKVGLMLWSRTPASTPFGGGTLCVAAPITRTTAQNSGGTALPASDCTGTYVFQFTSAMMSQAGLLVNDDVYAQYWSRDNGFAPPDNVGLTAGVHWEVCP